MVKRLLGNLEACIELALPHSVARKVLKVKCIQIFAVLHKNIGHFG